MLDYISKGNDFIKGIKAFESKLIDGADFSADLITKTGKLIEFKSWKKGTSHPWKSFFSGKTSSSAYKQFKNYLTNSNSLDKIEYIFDVKKVTEKEVKNAFKELFTKKSDEIFKVMKPELRENILGKENLNRFDLFQKKIKNIDSNLYKFINIK